MKYDSVQNKCIAQRNPVPNKPIEPYNYFLLDLFLLSRDPYLELIHVPFSRSRRKPSVYFILSYLC